MRVLNGETIQDISIQEKISYCAIRSWVMKYQELGYNGLMKKSRIKKYLEENY
ncbi:helix-turn-helix domain containing protein [Mycoplasmopsis caviae]|uniref:Helix-turn-helix domain containing protein n=1 Tax=Mycoplasmopsis caviae TaxID=55603 RepID=A0ABY5IZ59_9BACT|nr:helix-turn-helix domain-containing protein [Mycoplasmopsis caviae]UUD34803.1 helix-turn-helix domain containing protein [Mycoplasmopsis caviae]UUD35151.1 helix-turn-helix domain containing protein [Mycoplasmopsis caviae]UUD35161.1 helix-turn-helix domain containing protein [Mycoplasmopsis caviae]UUD35413.1 helix-turn-helix domain containing protein [Mycoplasmopsis caviae]